MYVEGCLCCVVGSEVGGSCVRDVDGTVKRKRLRMHCTMRLECDLVVAKPNKIECCNSLPVSPVSHPANDVALGRQKLRRSAVENHRNNINSFPGQSSLVLDPFAWCGLGDALARTSTACGLPPFTTKMWVILLNC